VLVAAFGIGFVTWQIERPPIELSGLEQLHGGMTTNDVRRLLGAPSSAWTRTNDSGQASPEWAYSRRMSWPIVYVYFKPDGTFASHRYDR
jgi:hypothetical protein